jgi:hypothetical protein
MLFIETASQQDKSGIKSVIAPISANRGSRGARSVRQELVLVIFSCKVSESIAYSLDRTLS